MAKGSSGSLKVTASNFNSNWKSILDTPEDLFFKSDVLNWIDYLSEDTRVLKYKKYGNYEQSLLHKLLVILKEDNNVLTSLLNKIDSQSTGKIISLIEQRTFDLSLYELIKRLKDNIRGPNLIETTNVMIRESIKRSPRDTFILISILIRYLLTIFSDKHIKEICEKSFSRSFFLPFKNSLLTTVSSNREVLGEVEHFWKEYLEITIKGSKEFDGPVESNLDALFYSNNYWLRDRTFMLRMVKQNLRSKIKDSPLNINTYFVGNNGGREVVSECIRTICINVIREFSGEYYPAGQKIFEMYNKHYFKALSSLTINHIYTKESDKRFTFESDLLEKAISTFLDVLSKLLVSKLDDFVNSQIQGFESLILQYCKKEKIETGEDIEKFDEFNFSLDFFKLIQDITSNMIPKLVSELLLIGKESLKDRVGFLAHQLASLIKYLCTSGYNLLPLQLQDEDFEKSLSDLFNELMQIEKTWEVFYEIGNIDLKGELMHIENVTLYDARKWHKGESFEWDLKKLSEQNENLRSNYLEYGHGFFKPFGSSESIRVPFNRNSARARILVSAPDSKIAASKAKGSLKKLFSTMVFEFADETREKYHPQVSNKFEALNINGKEGIYNVNFDRSDILEIEMDEKKTIEWYIQSTSVSHRASRIYRALSWFNAAFWEEDIYAKFALYWIGLEQLLELDVYANKREALLYIIPKVFVSWRDNGNADYALHTPLNEIVILLQNNEGYRDLLNNQERFREWEKRDYVILENLSLLRAIIKDSKLEQSIGNLEQWVDEHMGSIISFINKEREAIKFEIAYLYSKRNSIIHEGITEFPELPFFVKKLQIILKKMVSISLLFPSEESWELISRQFNRPFSVDVPQD